MTIIARQFGDQVLPNDLCDELKRHSQRLETAQGQLKSAALFFAKKESAYRQAKAIAQLSADGKTVDLRNAQVDIKCKEERQAAYYARAAKEAALENVRSIRAQLSALQSIAASVRSEIELASAPQPKW